jgi:hypothetical protein
MPTPACVSYQPPLLSHTSSATPSHPLSLGAGARLGTAAQRPRREQAMTKEDRATLDMAMQCWRQPKSWANERGEAGTGGSSVDLAPSPSHAGAVSLPHRVAAAEPLSPVNSTRRRASIPQAAWRCCAMLKAHVASVCFKCFRCFSGMNK